MYIHVVQPRDTIQSIADYYGISVRKLILDNGIENPNNLVIGQAVVIAHPKITYIVKEGDTLGDIANAHNVTVLQLLINNPQLSDQEFIYPGEVIVIKYNTRRKITIHGNAVPFINPGTLRKTLPYLTYLSIFNYTATTAGEIITYYDDTDIIRTAKEYGTVPLMLLTSLTLKGDANIRAAYDLLLNKYYQEKQIENILNILREKGYYGINISCEYINISTYKFYEVYLSKLTSRVKKEGYLVFITINPNITNIRNEIIFERIDLSYLDPMANNIIFMNYQWATNLNPPSPIISIENINEYLNYMNQFITSENILIGAAALGYDWELPYSSGQTSVNSLTLSRTINLASDVGAIIQFDENSQTPFFRYSIQSNGNYVEHIVWFIDARSINALLGLVIKHKLHGLGFWNITIFNPSLWLTIYSQYEIEKILI